MCDYDGEASDVWSARRIRARKAHKCCACAETIKPGDIYVRTGSLYDRSWTTYRHCVRCDMMIDAIMRENGSCATLLDCGTLWKDEIGAIPDDVAALAFALPRDFATEEATP